MKIEYTDRFVKHYQKRVANDPSLVKRFQERLRLFITDSRSPTLKNHLLKGKKIRLRAFSITGDIRVVYVVIGRVIHFLDIGTHNQVY